jgi:carbon-monoxide dehydrogenase small subunit
VRVTLAVNGDRIALDLEPRLTIADALREECGLTSAHLDCTDGTCGACTVLFDGEAIRSCLVLAVQGDGAHLRTVEGLAVDHPLRAALSAADAAECGVCLPGLVLLAAGAMERDPGLAGDPERLHRLLISNVCRRTGHETARQAVIRAASR